MLGLDWCLMIESRWKDKIRRKVAQNLPGNRAIAGRKDAGCNFNTYKQLNTVFNNLGMEHKPHNIFNADETGFQTDAGTQKVLCKKGSRNPNKFVGSTTKTPSMFCHAIGHFLPMFINCKCLHLYFRYSQNGPSRVGWRRRNSMICLKNVL